MKTFTKWTYNGENVLQRLTNLHRTFSGAERGKVIIRHNFTTNNSFFCYGVSEEPKTSLKNCPLGLSCCSINNQWFKRPTSRKYITGRKLGTRRSMSFNDAQTIAQVAINSDYTKILQKPKNIDRSSSWVSWVKPKRKWATQKNQ